MILLRLYTRTHAHKQNFADIHNALKKKEVFSTSTIALILYIQGDIS